MVNLSDLPATTTKTKKRLGRGYGSGKGGHTVGRGAKGAKARGKTPIWFEGGQLPLIRRLPFRRGKGKFSPLGKGPVIINLRQLNRFTPHTVITLDSLITAGLVTADLGKTLGVKILGDGDLKVPLTLTLPTSATAAAKIKAAGGKIEGRA